MIQLKDRLAHKKHVVWDWNGTLLNDVDAVLGAIGDLLEGHGLARVDRDQYRAVFGFPILEYYKKLGFDFEKESFEVLSERFVAHYAARASECALHSGSQDLFGALDKIGIVQSVLSAAHEPHLLRQLEHYGIRGHFRNVFGLSDHYAASKVARGKQLLDVCGFAAADTILVGDTDHDLEVGQELGIDVLLLADGHQSYERLRGLHHNVLERR